MATSIFFEVVPSRASQVMPCKKVVKISGSTSIAAQSRKFPAGNGAFHAGPEAGPHPLPLFGELLLVPATITHSQGCVRADCMRTDRAASVRSHRASSDIPFPEGP